MKHLARLALLAITVAGVGAPSTRALAQGTASPAIAIVFPRRNVLVKDQRDYDGLSTAVSSMIGIELARQTGARVVDRDQLQKLSGTVPLDRETAMHVGAMVNAQHTVYGDFSADATGHLRADVRAVDVTGGRVEYIDRLQDRTDEVVPLVSRLVTRLAAGLGLRATPGAGAALPTLPMQYVLMYGRALDLSDHGDVAGARELLGAVLESYPAFAPAKTALSRLK